MDKTTAAALGDVLATLVKLTESVQKLQVANGHLLVTNPKAAMQAIKESHEALEQANEDLNSFQGRLAEWLDSQQKAS
jgi:hypothetical protein